MNDWIKALIGHAADLWYEAQTKLDDRRVHLAADLERIQTEPEEPRVHCTKCGSTDHMLVCEYRGTKRLSCQRCERIFSVSHDGVPFEHHPRSLPYSPQIPEHREEHAGQSSNSAPPVPKRPADPAPRRRPLV